MKQILYRAPTKEAARAALKDFKTKWESKYSYASRGWENNWDELTVFFDFPVKIRKYTKNKLCFPTDDAVMKSIYLASKRKY